MVYKVLCIENNISPILKRGPFWRGQRKRGAFNINLRAHIEESVGAASSQNAPLPQTIGGMLVKSLLTYETVRSTSGLERNFVWDEGKGVIQH